MLDALGLTGTHIRINDRRVLAGLLASWGVPPESTDRALVVVDKLDKIGVDGVAAELVEVGVPTETSSSSLRQLETATWELGESGEAAAWLDAEAFAALVALRDALPGVDLRFDPTLVRGMGYYTGTIFEVSHPDFGYSLGGGGRYDGMIGRFLGQDVPAAGFSLGFERIVDLVDLPDDDEGDGVVLLHDRQADVAALARLRTDAIARWGRVRLDRRAKNTGAQLEGLARLGYGRFAFVRTGGEGVDELELKPLARD